ncbi:MAG: glycerophosphodiester phosphodiesterase family protein [Spirochaetales bacterium]|nr:glycerophosphodiester phosphodiesterase family protein [Spirochaetales bacterium]
MKRISIAFFLSALLIVIIACSTTSAGSKVDYSRPLLPEIVSYKVVIPSGSKTLITSAGSRICSGISAEVDGAVKHPLIGSDVSAVGEAEILFGSTNRPESAACAAGLGAMDYTIRVLESGKIVVVGGSSSAHAAAADKFVELVNNGTISTFEPFEYTYRFLDGFTPDPLTDADSPEFKALLAGWQEKFTSPEWGGMDRDLNESFYALTHKYSEGTGRIAVFAHRGDMSNYPENSLAGIVSAIMSGADSVEFDFRFTRDFIPVIIHDENLNRVTNWSEMAGKNGLPESIHVCDWTLAELKQLNLLDYYGNVTEFKVPTVYEGMLITRGRIQISFDDKTACGVSFDDEYIPLARTADAGSSLIQTVYRTNKNFTALNGMVDTQTMEFVMKCLSSGSFIGSYAFYADSTLFKEFGNDYLSLREDADAWDYILGLGKRYVGTNQCYKLSLYMRAKGMKAWTY